MVDKLVLVRVVKLLNIFAALMMIADAVLRILDFKDNSDPFFFLLTFYLFGFSLLLVLAELRIKKVIVFVEFLKSRLGKGIYTILVGVLIFNE